MKIIIVSFILGLFLIILPSAFAIEAMTMEEMTDSPVGRTTGQSGINIRGDNVVIEDFNLRLLYIGDDETLADASGTKISMTTGTQTRRAIFDYTNRSADPKGEYGTIMRKEPANGRVVHWVRLLIGGAVKPSELTISPSQKRLLNSYMKTFNQKASSLAEGKSAYDELRSLNLVYSKDTVTATANIKAVMAATGKGIGSASAAYRAARDYADLLAGKHTANRVGIKISLANINVPDVAGTLPKLEAHAGSDKVPHSVEAESTFNEAAEFIKITRSDNNVTNLSGHVELCANR